MTDAAWISFGTMVASIASTAGVVIVAIIQRGQGRKLDDVKTVAKENADVAAKATEKAVEVATEAAVKSEEIHVLVNSRLADEKEARAKAEAMNERLVAILESHGIDIKDNPRGVERGKDARP